MSRRRLVGVTFLLAWLAVTAVAEPPPDSGDEGRCLLARFGSGPDVETLNVTDLEPLRAMLEPAPSSAAAGRLLVDAAVAYRLDATRRLGTSSPSDWLSAYRAMIHEVWAESGPDDGPRRLRQRLDAGHEHLGVTLGSCYVPLSREINVDAVAKRGRGGKD